MSFEGRVAESSRVPHKCIEFNDDSGRKPLAEIFSQVKQEPYFMYSFSPDPYQVAHIIFSNFNTSVVWPTVGVSRLLIPHLYQWRGCLV